MRLLASIAICSAIASGTGCNFAVKHPSTTAGIVVGTLGFATCSLTTSIGEGDTSFAESGRAKCYGITAGAAIGIGLLAALAQWIGMEDPDPVTPAPSGTSVGDPANLPPAPVFVPKEPIAPPAPPSPAPRSPAPPVEPAPPPAEPIP